MFDLSIAARIRGHVAVGISCGKDATATLDLCSTRADRLSGFFLYMVPGLGFQERYLRYLEMRYSIQILRVPHFYNSTYRSSGAYCRPIDIPDVKQKDVFEFVREQTGAEWIALGEKKIDNPPRLWKLRKCQGVDEERRQIFPVANWTHNQVFNYLKQRCIPLPQDYRGGGITSFGGFVAKELSAIKKQYPEDYEKITQAYPFIGAAIKRAEIVEASKLRSGNDKAAAN